MKHFVYFDSTRKVFSVRDQSSRKVIWKSPRVEILDAEFRVSQRGRERVVRERRKTVHAGITGEARVAAVPNAGCSGRVVRYNPYQNTTFVFEDGTPALVASRVVLTVENGRAVCRCES